MSIKVQCPNPTCGKVFSVKEEFAGRKAKCPGCSSPLIIPIPDAGAFDFGALVGGTESGNPFAESGGPPAPTPAKSKLVKRPALESTSPFAQLGAAAPPPSVAASAAPPPVVEALVEPLPEGPTPATVAPPSIGPARVAGPGGFPTVGEPGPSFQQTEAEPWYYGFLEVYANVLMYLGIVGIVLGALIAMWTSLPWFQASLFYGVIYIGATLLVGALALLGVLLTVAFILLAVDAARNLRETRKLIGRGKPLE